MRTDKVLDYKQTIGVMKREVLAAKLTHSLMCTARKPTAHKSIYFGHQSS